MSRKQSSGIGRGRRAAKASGGSANVEKDIVFEAHTETREEVDKRIARYIKTHGHRPSLGTYFAGYKNPEAVKAIKALPDGAEFSIHDNGIGAELSPWTRYRVDRQSVMPINEDGTHGRRITIKTTSQISALVTGYHRERVVIHNGGKSLIKEKTPQEREAEWAELVRNMEAYNRRQERRAARRQSTS